MILKDRSPVSRGQSIHDLLSTLLSFTDAQVCDHLQQLGQDPSSPLWQMKQLARTGRTDLLDATIASSIHERFRGTKVEELVWDWLLGSLHMRWLPDSIASELLERMIAIDVVRFGTRSRTILERLADHDDTVSYWLVLENLEDRSGTPEALASLLTRFTSHERVFESLARRVPVDLEREAVIQAALMNRPNGQELLALRAARYRAIEAMNPNLSFDRAYDLFRSGDAHVLRSLAENPATPAPLLQELGSCRNTKFAAQIRAAANRNLRERHRS